MINTYDPITSTEKPCLHCGKLFPRPKYQGLGTWNKRRFCSISCSSTFTSVYKRKPPTIQLQCQRCHKSFLSHKTTSKYCCHPCFLESIRKPHRHRECKRCKSAFSITAHQNNKKYCDPCYKEVRKSGRAPKGEFRTCVTCARQFYVYPSQTKMVGSFIYCSNKCKRFKPALRTQQGLRDAVISRDRVCQICNYSEHLFCLDVHHIDQDRSHNQLDNLVLLCCMCHKILHRKKFPQEIQQKYLTPWPESPSEQLSETG